MMRPARPILSHPPVDSQSRPELQSYNSTADLQINKTHAPYPPIPTDLCDTSLTITPPAPPSAVVRSLHIYLLLTVLNPRYMSTYRRYALPLYHYIQTNF